MVSPTDPFNRPDDPTSATFSPPPGQLSGDERSELERLRRENEDLRRADDLRRTFNPAPQVPSPGQSMTDVSPPGNAPLGPRPGDATIQPVTLGEDDARQSHVSFEQLAATIAALKLVRTYENPHTRRSIRESLEGAGLKFRPTDPNNPNDVDTDSDGARAVALIQSLPVVTL